MIERDWFTSTDVYDLLDHLFPVRGLDSAEPQTRQSRLYLIACALRVWSQLPGVCRAVVSVAERVYSSRVPDRSLRDAAYPIAEELTHCRGEPERINAVGRALIDLATTQSNEYWVQSGIDPELWDGFAHLAYYPFAKHTPYFRRVPSNLHSAALVREVFGNPFSPEAFDGAWRSENVLQLARHAHATGDFSTLPVLADALEEAGCDRDDILEHLRHEGAHARGCWALELVLWD